MADSFGLHVFDVFHSHLLNCKKCFSDPFHLCGNGKKLLRLVQKKLTEEDIKFIKILYVDRPNIYGLK